MMKSLLAILVATTLSLPTVAQDDAKAERLFRRCAACHTLDEGGRNRVGPNLFGVFDRDIASRDDFRYSDALLSLEGRWNDDAINQYLLSPRTYARGTKMAFAGIRKTEDRLLLIDWLKRKTASASEATPAVANDPDLALLPDGPGKQETFDGCASCHSIKLVVQQGLDEDGWAEVIEWMVDEQGMDPLDGDLAQTITDYLATHFGVDRPNFRQ
ncbi:MAG: cytochrome c family protein [Kordiimonadaceae bacterium]|nr:cytochrome c family protein [Kordiimonadaceae bacterium]MBO6567643.1 cytochrome c family protein [Kordiimonadaceae bacterium]MBO6963143.1 cytochrome c family protein [Kordiimonadaceae bacterium]